MAKIKRSVSMILSVLMAASVLTTAPVSAATVEASDAGANVAEALQAELKIAEGSCGDKLTWTLGNDGVLEISGEGKMYDFDFEAKEGENSFNPWTLYRDQIKKVVVAISSTQKHLPSRQQRKKQQRLLLKKQQRTLLSL